MNAELISYTSNPEKTCAAAAAGCYSDQAASQILHEISKEKIGSILRNVIKMGHVSAIEHANFTFSISGVSRALSHQLVRHRIASYSQQSQRYVKYDKIDFVTPLSIQNNINANKKFTEFMEKINEIYQELIAEGIPAEDARYVLPNAASTAITVSMNARELLHFYELRSCTKAQWEIRELAEKMMQAARNVAPILFENAGPPCVLYGICREKNSCSRLKIIQK